MDDDEIAPTCPFITDDYDDAKDGTATNCDDDNFIVTSFIVEEPDDDEDNANFESRAEAANAANEALVCEMQREDERDEARRDASVAGKKPAPKRRTQSAPARKRAPSRARAPSGQSKIEKMRAKHMRSTVRDAEKIIAETMRDNETDDVRKVRIEAQHAQQHAMAALRELRQLMSSSTKTKEALRQHNELTTKLRRFLQMRDDGTSSAAAVDSMHDIILVDCIEAITAQANTITTIHDRVNKLVRLYSENTAKCEATSRRAFDTSTQYTPSMPTMQYKKNDTLIKNGKIHDEEAQQNAMITEAPTPAAASAPINPNDPIFSVRTGNGYYDLTTRPAPQIIRGKPGTHYIAFSVARRKGSAQQLAQNETVRSALNVQRLAKLAKKKRAFGELITGMPHLNGDDALAQIEAPESASRAQIANGDNTNNRVKQITGADSSEPTVKKKK